MSNGLPEVVEPKDEEDAGGAQVNGAAKQQLDDFDWDDFDGRFEEAMKSANQKEEALLQEFDQLAAVSSFKYMTSQANGFQVFRGLGGCCFNS
jgi:hypothetical protein